ncbi:MAG TPA: hypothetical protein VNU01_03580, partial [Egibacteraceae bacterium]|nr:hypothetical protein [Egibacteraceae bacterium]
MEIMMRVAVPDRPGALAALAGAIGEQGGDIQAVEVVDHAQGEALDDLVVWIDGPERLRALVACVDELDGFRLVHAGPSRGHPGDAVTRVAMGLGALLDTSMTEDHALVTLVGGLLRADSAEMLPAEDAPRADAKTLVLPFADRVLVARRDYRFTET